MPYPLLSHAARLVFSTFASIALYVIAWGITPAPSKAWCPMTTGQSSVPNSSSEPCPSDGIPLLWPRRCISFAIDERGADGLSAEEMREAVSNSFTSWISVTCAETDAHPAGPIDLEIAVLDDFATCLKGEVCGNGNVNVAGAIRNWSQFGGSRGVFAQTITNADRETGAILSADILINDDDREGRNYADCAQPSTCTDGETDLHSVMTHEIGHFFGLGHASEVELGPLRAREATMYDSMEVDDIAKRTLADDDKEGICASYPPGTFDSSRSCSSNDFLPLRGLRLNCEDTECAPLTRGCGCHLPGDPRADDMRPLAYALTALILWALRRRRPLKPTR